MAFRVHCGRLSALSAAEIALRLMAAALGFATAKRFYFGYNLRMRFRHVSLRPSHFPAELRLRVRAAASLAAGLLSNCSDGAKNLAHENGGRRFFDKERLC